MNMVTSSWEKPIWLVKGKIDEVRFCEAFLVEHPMICIHESLFTVDGKVPDLDKVRNEIYNQIKPYWRTSIYKKVSALLDALRTECYSDPLPICQDRIHMANGTLFLDGRFEAAKDFCMNRLAVAYNPQAETPRRWLQFLNELLAPEDILTLQEYIGYCLIPCTKAQKMLMVIGKGGEGKSRIGTVLSALFGTSMKTGSIAKVETSPFARADLEFQKKGKQSFQGTMYARLIGFGNGTMKSLYDRSYGFFRRQIILTTKNRPRDRVDDPFLSEKLIAEAEAIFLWALEGLKRLIANNYQFTISEQARQNLEENISEGNNVTAFLKSEGYIEFKADYEISSQRLYELYKLWCQDNALNALSLHSFCVQMAALSSDYRLEQTNRIRVNGRYVRGYVGIYSDLPP